MSSSAPWDIYTAQLFPLRYGHPLWIPEPHDREVEIGDVGWIQDGEFCPLFNAMKPETDPINLEKGVPNGFKMFSPEKSYTTAGDKIMQKLVCSRSIHTMDAQGDVEASTGTPLPVSASAGIAFHTKTDSGALLFLDPPGQSKEIRSKLHIEEYMYDNHASWLEFANASNGYGLGLEGQDIVFVCGTIKTTKWAVAAFQGNGLSQKKGYVMGEVGGYAGVGFSISISDQILPAEHYRHGPRSARAIASDRLLCLFVHYYKMKRRSVLWPFKKPMRAAGGPHQLPPGPDNSGEDAPAIAGTTYECESEQGTDITEGCDPVNVLLDYILSRSLKAEVAITSDLDLYGIFADREFPNTSDIFAALEEVKPTIEVDNRGVATISINLGAAGKRMNESHAEREQTPERAQSQSTGRSPFDGPVQSTSMPYSPQQEDAPMWDVSPTSSPSLSALSIPGSDDDDTSLDNSQEKAAGKRPGQSSVHEGSVTALAYSGDGSFVVSGSQDGCVIILDVHGSTESRRLEGHQGTISALAFSRDSSVLASASHDGCIILWDVASGTKRAEIRLDIAVESIAYTPDGAKLIAGADDGRLHIWEATTYQLERTIEKHADVVRFIIFSHDGQLMGTGGTERMCYIWDTMQLVAENPEPLSVLAMDGGMICAAAFSPDGDRIVTASDDGNSCIWRAATGEALVTLHEHVGPVWSVTFSPDGRCIASGSSDSTVKVCDSYSGKRLLSLEEHDDMINTVEFSPDGHWILSASSDNTVRLWTANDGVCTRIFNEHEDVVASLKISPDGQMLASSSQDGAVQIRSLLGAYQQG